MGTTTVIQIMSGIIIFILGYIIGNCLDTSPRIIDFACTEQTVIVIYSDGTRMMIHAKDIDRREFNAISSNLKRNIKVTK